MQTFSLRVWVFLAVAATSGTLGTVPASAQRKPEHPATVPIEPPPPGAPADIRDGRPLAVDVHWVTGPAGPDWRLGPTRPMDGRTAYRIDIDYRLRFRWRWRANRLWVRPAFTRLLYRIDHEVWLRSVPGPEQFWKDPIVCHEMDHVRISADPRWEKQLRESVEPRWHEAASREEVPPGGVDEFVAAWCERWFADRLADVESSIDFRYRELDRATRHGTLPLPVGFFGSVPENDPPDVKLRGDRGPSAASR